MTLYIVLALHWIADFVVQTKWQAENKSNSKSALGQHIATYMATMFGGLFLYSMLPFTQEISTQALTAYVGVNGLLHMGTDFITAPLSRKAFEAKSNKEFWTIIGGDQFVHNATLILTLGLLT